MSNDIYVLLSSQIAGLRQGEIIANNAANNGTTAFQKEEVVFAQYIKDEAPGKPIAYTRDVVTVTDQSPGVLRSTQQRSDLAIINGGYFVLQTPQGLRYTRAGDFRLYNGNLVNANGYAVLDGNGAPLALDPEILDFVVDETGAVFQNGEEVGNIAIMNFANPQLLRKVGRNLFESPVPAQPAQNFRVAQGVLEESNVNSIEVTRQMIELERLVNQNNQLMLLIMDTRSKAHNVLSKQGN
jgi:flagellar basal-body rod protein FlgF